ncbi:galectin-9 isoform X2 [Rhineura floridana]|uniref:galectin-9 isoform X2 n=1 Tax=Rhineura floridana TaxID=261503 RepID=UPI002AC81387|nr:galectin-9 isoform X2 [Rhineura floridana]
MAFQAPYYKPSLPFTGPIYGGLRDGLKVLVSGSVLTSCKSFCINFQCGQSTRPDIAFHFNPRFTEACVVWNSFERGSWQQEERNHDMPFYKGQAFEIQFLVNSTSYQVVVNGKHYVDFKHRIPISKVDTIGVSGELDMASISLQGSSFPDVSAPGSGPVMASSPYQTNMTYLPGPACQQNAVFPPGPYFQTQTYTVPYRASIFGGLYPSRNIVLSGTVSPDACRFHINLKTSSNIAFHLNPRFHENVIVRNTNQYGRWGSEERDLPSGMPLSRGQNFTIWILCEQQFFRVAVNGQHLFNYNHRVSNLQQIDQLEVEGDVTLSKVQV